MSSSSYQHKPSHGYQPGCTGSTSWPATSAWAVGAAGSSNTRPIVTRWDGFRLVVGYHAPAGDVVGAPRRAIGSSEDDVWTVGGAGEIDVDLSGGTGSRGRSCRARPCASATDSTLRAVKVFDANDAWAVGDAAVAPGMFHQRGLIVRWNSAAWSTVPSPSPDPRVEALLDAVDGTANEPCGLLATSATTGTAAAQ